MSDSTGYAIIGIGVLIFLFQLIIIWYMWWMYTQLNDNDNDITDMIIDVYKLEVIDARSNGREAKLDIPKRAWNSYNRRHKKNENCDDPCN